MDKKEKVYTNPVKAIGSFCLDCSGGNYRDRDNCNGRSGGKPCQLYPFRNGKNPFRTKKEYSEEELAERRERMRKINERNDKATLETP